MNSIFWQNILMFAQRQDCFCAFCKTPKKVYKRKSLSLLEVVALSLLSLLMTSVIFEHLDPRGLIILISMVSICEFFFRLRWRYSTICNNCGFDPVVYVKDPDLAAEKVRKFMEERKDNPDFLLKPTINLPPRRVSPPDRFAGASKSPVPTKIKSPSKISLRV
jgi:hypothetical protein